MKKTRQLVPSVILPEKPDCQVIRVNPSKIYQLFLQGQSNKVCEAIIQVLDYFEKHNYRTIDAEAVSHINDFVAIVFALFSNPEFKIPDDKYGFPLVKKSHLFANLVRISSYKTTDHVLTHILNQQENFVKLLFLYTARNTTHIPAKQLFDTNPIYASLWYFSYILPSIGQLDQIVYKNLKRHILDMDDRYVLSDRRLTPLYFACTYLNDRADHRVKRILNREAKKIASQIKVKNTPSRDSIAIITSKWFENSAVHKSSSPLIDRLRERYRLTLIHLGDKRPASLITEPFEIVHHLKFENNKLLTDLIENNDFQMAYFPDIGMNDESVWLSNIRFAPIQVTSYGHPVSTFSDEMDYFIAGADSEVHADLEKNYSERVVLIPGIGAHPTQPNYKAKFPKKRTDKMIVACPWGPDKYTWPMAQTLKQIANASDKPVEFQFFCSKGVHRYQGFLLFVADVRQLLPGIVKIHADKEYFDYMAEMEYSDFALNSFPFGGYNTVYEALYLHKPVITIEGDKFYNKAGACLLRRVGLGDLVTHSMDQFIDLTIRMLNDPDFLHEKQKHLRNLDLQKVLFNTEEPVYFEEAIEYLIDNHEQLKGDGSRSPIIIGD